MKVTNGLDMSSTKVANVANGTSANDAVNKSQLDAAVNGLGWREKVRVVATANVNITNGLENGDTIDGVTLVTGDRVLLPAQTTASQNGIYVVPATGAASRATDLAAGANAANAAVFVTEGTVYADTQWKCTDNVGSDVVGTNNLAFVQFASATNYAVDDSTIEVNSNTLRVKDLGITPAKMSADNKTYATDIGNGSSTSITVTHNLGTRDVFVEVYDKSTYETVICDVVRTSGNVVTLTFAVAPSNNSLRCLVRP